MRGRRRSSTTSNKRAYTNYNCLHPTAIMKFKNSPAQGRPFATLHTMLASPIPFILKENMLPESRQYFWEITFICKCLSCEV